MNKEISTKRIAWLSTIMALLTLCSACTRTAKWDEEVQLSDGRVITLSRKITYRYNQPAGERGGWLATKERLAFTDPVSKKEIEWVSSDGMTYYFDRISGHYVLIMLRNICMSLGGNWSWDAYSFDGEKWLDSSVNIVPRAFSPNLVLDLAEYLNMSNQTKINITLKKKMNAASRVGEVVRSIVVRNKPNC